MKLKLSEVQKHKIQNALRDTTDVLREIKLKTLKGEALTDMKALEQSVQGLEVFAIGK